MFVRKKKNPSGVVSVQIIDKSHGKYKVIKTIGSSSDPIQIERLFVEGQSWIKQNLGLLEMDLYDEKSHLESLLTQIEQIRTSGSELLLGQIYDEIGFNQLSEPLLRKLVIARICFPVSKLQTTDFLSKYESFEVSVDQVYRFMDKLHGQHKEQVQQISYAHTLKVLNGQMSVVFYDVTTLYFEIDREDDLRKTGFSKEGKHQHPQVLLGLLVSINGYPLAYEIFEGNKFEGNTMMPLLDRFKKKYKLSQLVVVADSGLISKDNIEKLEQGGYEYILGARIKNSPAPIKEKILALSLDNGQSRLIPLPGNQNLIITYSQKRAQKDQHNREKGLQRLQNKIHSGKLTKANLNNRGYNKYLKLKGELEISIDLEKLKKDKQWDGLKGYLTNTELPKEEVIRNYKELWKIKKAFRIAKRDLRIRPIFHYLPRRIEAHITIAFVAYKVYKELERQLETKKAKISPEKAIAIAKTIYTIRIRTKTTKEVIEKTILSTKEQIELATMFNLK